MGLPGLNVKMEVGYFWAQEGDVGESEGRTGVSCVLGVSEGHRCFLGGRIAPWQMARTSA